MGIVRREATRVTIISYIGLVLGYINKGILFVLILSKEEVGLINLIISVAALFAQFTNLGVVNSIPRFYPFLKNPARQNYGFFSFNFYVILFGSVLMSLIILLINDWVVYFYGTKSPLFVDYYFWVLPVGISLLWYKFLDSYLRVLYKNTISAFANDFVLRVFTLLLIGVYALDWIRFDLFLIIICLLHFIPFLIIAVYLVKLGEWKVSWKIIQVPKRMRRIIYSYSLFSYLNSLGAMVVVTIDSMMVASKIGLAATGVYTTVVFITRALMIPYTSIARVSSPLVAEYWKRNDLKSMKQLYQKTSSVNIFIGLLLFLGVWVNREVLFSFFPEGYQSGIYVFLFLMVGRLLDMFFGLNGTILVTSKKYKYDVLFTGGLFILVICLNLWFIPIWGLHGAAISTAIALWLYNFARLFFVWRVFRIHPFNSSQFYIIGVFILSLLIVELVIPKVENVWISLILNSLAVFVTFPLIIIGFNIEKEAARYIRMLFRRKVSE